MEKEGGETGKMEGGPESPPPASLDRQQLEQIWNVIENNLKEVFPFLLK